MDLDANTIRILRGIQTEIRAGKALFWQSLPESVAWETWNNATERAVRIIQNYIDGFGLFSAPSYMRGDKPDND